MTTRSEARALAKQTLIALGDYTVSDGGSGTLNLVFTGSPESFAGLSPVAIVTSRSMQLTAIARSLYEVASGVTVSIYVRHGPSTAESEAAEDQLDSLTRRAIVALHATGVFTVGESNAAAEGAPNRMIDGVLYRVERIPLSVLDEGSG